MAPNVNVLIAGAGPVGLTMANELTRYGLSVRIVDKTAERTDKSKALVLWSRTLELFDHAGYVDPFLAAGMQAHGAQMSNGRDVIARVSLDDIDSPYPYALMIPQSDTERILEERLEKRASRSSAPWRWRASPIRATRFRPCCARRAARARR